jgi:hypothetical protein
MEYWSFGVMVENRIADHKVVISSTSQFDDLRGESYRAKTISEWFADHFSDFYMSGNDFSNSPVLQYPNTPVL